MVFALPSAAKYLANGEFCILNDMLVIRVKFSDNIPKIPGYIGCGYDIKKIKKFQDQVVKYERPNERLHRTVIGHFQSLKNVFCHDISVLVCRYMVCRPIIS